MGRITYLGLGKNTPKRTGLPLLTRQPGYLYPIKRPVAFRPHLAAGLAFSVSYN